MIEAQTKKGLKSAWSLSAEAWEGFLRWLDDGPDSGGEAYLQMRRRLVTFFDRKNCLNPDDLADETLDRVARRLEEEKTIDTETPAKFCYTVARFVFLESLRSKDAKSDSIDQMSRANELKSAVVGPNEDREIKEKRLGCLDKCSGELETANRDLIFSYYFGKERLKIDNRRSMAASLGISTNALSIRAHRIRGKIEDCVRRCCGER